MIISKTPVRVSFFGGGTDYPDYFLQHGGAVLSTSIDKYTFITVKALKGISDFNYRIAYSRLEQCNHVDEIVHPVVRECIRFMKIEHPLEVNVISDLPARSGIGSSSSFTVGLLHAFYALKGKIVSKEQLAQEAIHIEQVVLKERVGVQDQYAAALGGLNYMDLKKGGSIEVTPIFATKERIKLLESHLMMFYTGISRYAHQVLEEQINNTKENKVTPDLDRIKAMVVEGMNILASDKDLCLFGELLHEGWMTKKRLSSAISNDHLDNMYDAARNAGAIGGKLLGAGGGGFFVFFVPHRKQDDVRIALLDYPLIPFQFENDGSRIIFMS